MSNHIALFVKYLANWVNPASWNSLQVSHTWQHIHQLSKRVSLMVEGNICSQRPQAALNCYCCSWREGEQVSHCFELEMTSHLGSSIKVSHHCLLMDDKVWFNTHAHTHRSLLTPVTVVIKGHTIIPSQTGKNQLLGITADCTAFMLNVHQLHPPGVGHLLLSLCPTGDLVKRQLSTLTSSPGESDG